MSDSQNNQVNLESLDEFESRLAVAWPPAKWCNVSVLIAVSGGADSVALLLALFAIRQTFAETPNSRFEVAHFNHRWRGEASDQDQLFVASLCQQLKILFHNARASDEKNRTEASARDERYDFLQRIAEERGARYLVTAHTADDQAETVLHRILRGTGLRGLRGIQATRRLSQAVSVTRPILWASRADVIRYLDRKGQGFRKDSSNKDPSFTRNRIRLELLPQLAQNYNPAVKASFLRLGVMASEVLEELRPVVAANAQECCLDTEEGSVRLCKNTLQRKSEYMQREILIFWWRQQGWPEGGMSQKHWNRMVQAIASSQKQVCPGDIMLDVQQNDVLLAKK